LLQSSNPTQAPGPKPQALSLIRIWDAPTRLVHWLLVALVAFSWWSAENHHMDWHRYSGYTLLGVLVFRVYWGIVGSSTARFAQFVKGPRAVMAYAKSLRDSNGANLSSVIPAQAGIHALDTEIKIDSRLRGNDGTRIEQINLVPLLRDSTSALTSEPTAYSQQPTASLGHNPLGALSALALLGLLIAQVSLGLFAVDVDGLESGPLSYLVSFETGRLCAEIHEWVFNTLMVFVTLHVGAILFYLIAKRDNLLGPMITGVKTVAVPSLPTIKLAAWWLALPGIAIAALIVWLIA